MGFLQRQLPAVIAETAFFHDTAHADGDIGAERFFHALGPYRIPPIKIPGMVGASPHAVSAAETAGVDLANDAGFEAVVCRRRGTNGYAGRMSTVSFAMHTGSGQVTDIGIRKGFLVAQLVDPHPGKTEQFISFIFLERNVVFLHAGNHTAAAASTLVQVDHHAVLLGSTLSLFGRVRIAVSL